MKRFILYLLVGSLLNLPAWVVGQEPMDLFADAPSYASGYIRIGSWNVRHLNVESQSQSFFRGPSREADFAILIGSFAKAIRDLQLDVVVLIEVQPRPDEADRLLQLVQQLNLSAQGDWRSDVTHLEYDEPDDPFGNLQFGVLWNAARGVEIDPSRNQVLEELRQPRSPTGELLRKEQRAPWLIPVSLRPPGTKCLELDLLVLHLKSGGTTPQAAEVDAVARFIRGHQMRTSPRHLLVCGDWNIRPDESDGGRGRPRLRKLMVPNGQESLMRLLTVGEIPPDLAEWEQLADRFGELRRFPAMGRILPYSHIELRADGYDALLDHVAISRTLDELFDHPLEVQLANGQCDLRPGIEIVPPLVSRADFAHFTDHLPTVLTLKVDDIRRDSPVAGVRILAIDPNPRGEESEMERVVLKNASTESVELVGWRIQNSAGRCWTLDEKDSDQRNASLARGRSVTIYRRGRAMTLSNSGDTVSLFDSSGKLIDTQKYGPTRTGETIRTDRG